MAHDVPPNTPRKRRMSGRGIESGYGNNCSPVSASSTKIALTGQFSAASRIFSTVTPAGSTASDCRFSLRRNTLGAIVSHIALPTQTSWSTRMRSLRANDHSYCQVTGSDFSDRKLMFG